jgi:hypothetical protein
MFHNFPDERGVGDDCLVKSTNFVYTDVRGTSTASNLGDPLATFLKSVTAFIYRRNGNTYDSAFLPPVQCVANGIDETELVAPSGDDELCFS